MRQLCGNWRAKAWIWYLALTGPLTAAYFFFPGLKGSGPLINGLGFSGVAAIRVDSLKHSRMTSMTGRRDSLQRCARRRRRRPLQA